MLVAACGGGGDNDTSATTPPPVNAGPPAVTLTAPAALVTGLTGTLTPSASAATVQFGGTATQPRGFTRNTAWVTGLVGGTAFAQAADGRIFVARQTGAVRVIENGALPAAPFAAVAVDSSGERGLIGLARVVWASGLRNPFTFAVQPGTGRSHINDAGQDTWEEIDLGAAGANYGWPASEGPANVTTGVTAPLFAYAHRAATPAGSPVDPLVGIDGAVYVLTRDVITRISAP